MLLLYRVRYDPTLALVMGENLQKIKLHFLISRTSNLDWLWGHGEKKVRQAIVAFSSTSYLPDPNLHSVDIPIVRVKVDCDFEFVEESHIFVHLVRPP